MSLLVVTPVMQKQTRNKTDNATFLRKIFDKNEITWIFVCKKEISKQVIGMVRTLLVDNIFGTQNHNERM